MPPYNSSFEGWANHSETYLANCGEAIKDFELERRLYKIYPREEYTLFPQSSYTKISKGEERFRYFHWLVENAFWVPEYFQQEFLAKALQVAAESVVGEKDWPQVGPLLIEEFGWKMRRNNKMLLGMAPRRFGKSIVMSMIITAGLLTVPNLNAATFGIVGRTSENMISYVLQALEMSGNTHRIRRKGEDFVEVQGDSPSDIRVIRAYPSNADISLLVLFRFFLLLFYVFFLCCCGQRSREKKGTYTLSHAHKRK